MPDPLPINVDPQEAIDFFRSKGRHVGFDWRDTWEKEHGRSFTVAKMMQADLLADTQRVVDRAIAEGWTFDRFRAELEPMLKARGWWGRQDMRDPVTGQIRNVQLGSTNPLKIIYDTNLRTAMAAGRYERIVRVARHRPYLRYTAVLDNRTRPLHAAWHGTILPWDDPWWNEHFPPNGWNCRCRVQQLSDSDLKRRGLAVSDRPSAGVSTYVNPRTGEVHQIPDGIDPGFAYHVGRSNPGAEAAQQLLTKAAGLDPDLAYEAINPGTWARVKPHLALDIAQWILEIEAGRRVSPTERRVVALIPPTVAAQMAAAGQAPASAGVTLSGRDGAQIVRQSQAGKAISAADLRALVDKLDKPRAILREKKTGHLLYVFDPADPTRPVKVVVRVDVGSGRRRKLGANAIRTATERPVLELRGAGYEVLQGGL